MIPISAPLQEIGAQVEWNGATRTVQITTQATAQAQQRPQNTAFDPHSDKPEVEVRLNRETIQLSTPARRIGTRVDDTWGPGGDALIAIPFREMMELVRPNAPLVWDGFNVSWEHAYGTMHIWVQEGDTGFRMIDHVGGVPFEPRQTSQFAFYRVGEELMVNVRMFSFLFSYTSFSVLEQGPDFISAWANEPTPRTLDPATLDQRHATLKDFFDAGYNRAEAQHMFEYGFFLATNDLRQENGNLPPHTWSEEMNRAARAHSVDIHYNPGPHIRTQTGQLDAHAGSDGSSPGERGHREGAHVIVIGENMGSISTEWTPRERTYGWRGNHHRALLRDHSHSGFGISFFIHDDGTHAGLVTFKSGRHDYTRTN
jgi:hypothetical protein